VCETSVDTEDVRLSDITILIVHFIAVH
jgi:hypothetical protein